MSVIGLDNLVGVLCHIKLLSKGYAFFLDPGDTNRTGLGPFHIALTNPAGERGSEDQVVIPPEAPALQVVFGVAGRLELHKLTHQQAGELHALCDLESL
jgi:hypothetical protein